MKPNMLKLYIDSGIDLKNNYNMHECVYINLIEIISCEKVRFKFIYDFIGELVVYGYSLTTPLIRSCARSWLPEDDFKDKSNNIDFSLFVHYIIKWIYYVPSLELKFHPYYLLDAARMKSKLDTISLEKSFEVFQKVINLVFPTTDLNMVYGTCGTIIQILQNNEYWYGNEHMNKFCNEKKHMAISYLKSLGALGSINSLGQDAE